MKYFFAGAEIHYKRLYGMGVKDYLFSFLNGKDKSWEVPKEEGMTFFMDSGAHSYQKGTELNLDKLEAFKDRYKAFIQKYEEKFDYFAELDIENVVGLDLVERWFEELHATSKKVIPVWHINRGIDKFKFYVKNYPFLAIGKVNTLPNDTLNALVGEAYKNGTKIHGFALTGPDWLFQVPFYSVDSTSWLAGETFGKVGAFNPNTLSMEKYSYREPKFFEKYGNQIEDVEAFMNDYKVRTRFVISQYHKMLQYANDSWKAKGIDWGD